MNSRNEEEQLRSVALQNANVILSARQEVERELAAERERLRITLASIGDGVISIDAAGRVSYVNGVAESLTGWTQSEAAGRHLSDVFHIVNEQTRQPVENPALHALRQGTVFGLANNTILIARDSTERPIDDSASPMRNEAGTTVGAVLVFRDATERMRAEETRARLAAIVESSDDAIVSKSIDGIIRTWNSGAELLFGYLPDEAIGQPITLIIPPERLAEEERMILDRLVRGERIHHFETVRVSKSGSRIDVSLTVSPLRNADGQVIGASKVARDVSEKKRAENALRASEESYRQAAAEAAAAAEANAKFRAFFEQGTNFACVLALNGTVLEANRHSLDACGFSREEALGRLFWECGWWNRAPELMERVRSASLQAAAGRPFRSETNYFVASGAERMIEMILAPVTDDKGRVLFVAATGIDVTERRRMEDALRETDRKKDDFIALLAHELRNPLAPIRSGLQVVRLSEDPALREHTQAMMDRQLGHMVRMVDDLLEVSRITRNKMELRRSRVLLAEVVGSAVETVRPLVDLAGHKLMVELPHESIVLDADLTRLAQVFSNLLTNSAKYTAPGGSISLTAGCDGREVIVRVRDTGIGIPADSLPHVFDMFSQVDRSIEKTTGGLGIGLALVKGFVEMHGGTVAAESAGPGCGSTFTVRLPLFEDRDELPTEDLVGHPLPRDARRVLVVDDNLDGAESMAMMLELSGHKVSTAHDGIEALERAKSFRPEVILMDVGMPRLNGLEATRKIRAEPWGRSIIIIALTGWGQEGDRLRSRDAGCDGHLVKPVKLTDLEKMLEELRSNRC